MSRLDKFGASNDRWTQGERRDCRQHWRILQMLASALGYDWKFRSSADVFRGIVAEYPSFSGMSYEALDERHGIVLGKSAEPEAEVVVYDSHSMKPN